MKQAKDIMTTNPACCMPEHNVQQAAEMMVKHDCGEIPVVESAWFCAHCQKRAR